MGQTIIEKILSKNLGRAVRAGDEALFEPDLTVAYDYPGYIDSYEKQMDELGVTSVAHPDKFLFFIDHFNPAGDSKSREVHVKTRSFAKRMGIQLWEDVGIGHQVIMEKGYVVPGTMLIHFDGHVSTLGSVGAGAISVRNAVIEALATGKVSIVVPGTLRVNFTGKLEKGVTARDVFHTLVQRLGPSGACSLCLEFGGEGLKNLTMDDRITLCNQAMFLSAVTAVCEQDDVNERVFMCGEADFGGRLALSFANNHRFSYCGCKPAITDVFIGATALVAEYNGVPKAPHIQDELAELEATAELVYGAGIAASTTSKVTPSGAREPNFMYTNCGRFHAGKNIMHEYDILISATGGMAATLPFEGDWLSPATRPYLEKYIMRNPKISAENQHRLFRFLDDFTVSAWCGMEQAAGIHGGGSPIMEKIGIRTNYDVEKRKNIVKRLAGIDDSKNEG